MFKVKIQADLPFKWDSEREFAYDEADVEEHGSIEGIWARLVDQEDSVV